MSTLLAYFVFCLVVSRTQANEASTSSDPTVGPVEFLSSMSSSSPDESTTMADIDSTTILSSKEASTSSDPTVGPVEFLSSMSSSSPDELTTMADIDSTTILSSKVPDFLANDTSTEIQIGDNCTADLTLNWCFLDLASHPEGCLTLGGVIQEVVPRDTTGLGELLGAGGDYNPINRGIERAYVDRCSDSFQIETSVAQDLDIIPGFLNLIKPKLKLSYHFSLKHYGLTFISILTLGRKQFRVRVTKASNYLEIAGKTMNKVGLIDRLISDLTSPLIPGDALRSIIKNVNLDNYSISEVGIQVRVTDGGFGIKLDFLAVRNKQSNRFTLNINRGFWGYDRGLGITMTGEFHDIKPVDKISEMTGFDISQLPLIGNVQVPSLALLVGTKDLHNPIIPIRLETFSEIAHVTKGIGLAFALSKGSNNKTFTAMVNIGPAGIDFRFLGTSEINLLDIIDGVIELFNIPLPSQWTLDNFLALEVNAFRYIPQTKTLHLEIHQVETISLIGDGLKFSDTTLMLDVFFSGEQGSRFSVDLMTVWEIRDVDVHLRVHKPPGRSPWMAEGRPDVEIPIGSLVEKFAVSLTPPGVLRNGTAALGFDTFHIIEPVVQIFLSSETAAVKVAGTARFGDWKATTVETFIGKVQGVTAMALGLVLERLPLTTFIKTMTDQTIDLSVLPGSTLLDHSTVGVIISSQFIPKATQYMKFEAGFLSDLNVVEGLSIASSFIIPDDCRDDEFCKLLQKGLGAGTGGILRGTVNIPNVRLTAMIPRNLSLITGLAITDVGFELEAGTRNALGLTGKMILSEPRSVFPKDVILFGSIGVSPSGFYLQMSMREFWERPFGKNFVRIGNLHLRVAISPDPILISLLEFGGQGYIGDMNLPNPQPIFLSLYIAINRNVLTQSFFMGQINKLTVPAIVRAFQPGIQLPKLLEHVGFPDGVNCSMALESRILQNGIIIPRGFYLRGLLSIFDFKVWADAKVSMAGIYFNMTVYPFSIAGGLISLKGLEDDKGPHVLIDLSWNPPKAKLEIQAKATVLLITASINVSIDHREMYFELTGKLLNLFEASFKFRARYSNLDEADFMVEAWFKQTFLSDMESRVIKALNKYREIATTAISGAQASVESAKEKFDSASIAVASKQEEVHSAQQKFDKAVSALARARNDVERKKVVFERASNSVAIARNAVNSKNADLNQAQQKLWNAQGSVRSKKANFDRAVRDLEGKKAAVYREQYKLNQARDEFRRKEQSCPSACRKKREAIDIFLKANKAKSIIEKPRKRVRRGWGWFEERKEDVAEKGREVARATKCAALHTARQTCLAGLRAIQGTINAASHTLRVATGALTAAQRVVDASKVSLDIAEAGLKAAEGGVKVARGGLEVAKGALRAAEETVRQSKHLLDAAKGVLSAAQVTVDQSRRTLDVAKGALKAASVVVKESQVTLNAAVVTLEGVKQANSFGVKIAEKVVSGVTLVDVQEVYFHLRLAVVESGILDTKVTASFFGERNKSFRFTINIRSISSFVDFLVDQAKQALDVLQNIG